MAVISAVVTIVAALIGAVGSIAAAIITVRASQITAITTVSPIPPTTTVAPPPKPPSSALQSRPPPPTFAPGKTAYLIMGWILVALLLLSGGYLLMVGTAIYGAPDAFNLMFSPMATAGPRKVPEIDYKTTVQIIAGAWAIGIISIIIAIWAGKSLRRVSRHLAPQSN
jgi:hypothetical protein